MISSSVRPARSIPGTVGTPARAASSFAATLSPSSSIAAGGGPIQVTRAGAREVRALGQKAVAGVHRGGPAARDGRQDALDAR